MHEKPAGNRGWYVRTGYPQGRSSAVAMARWVLLSLKLLSEKPAGPPRWPAGHEHHDAQAARWSVRVTSLQCRGASAAAALGTQAVISWWSTSIDI